MIYHTRGALPVRLRDRRRRVRGLRARQPPVGRSRPPGARARGGSRRPALGRLRPHAGGARVPDRQPLLRLALRVRARAAHARPPHLPRPREAARRIELDQRDDLPARQPAGLRALGVGPRDGDLGPRPLPALLQADGDLPRGRGGRPVPRPRRAARARARPGARPALRRVLRRRPGGRLPADRGRQRLPPGGLREVRPQRPPRAPAVGRARVPAPGHGPAEPRRGHARARDPDPDRGRAGDRRRGRPARWPRHPPDRRRRGDPVRRRDQLAAAAPALRGRRGGRAARARRQGPRRSPRRGGEPAGPPRGLRPARRHPAGDDGAALPHVRAAEGRAGVAPAQERPGRHEPLRGGRLRALERRRRATRT